MTNVNSLYASIEHLNDTSAGAIARKLDAQDGASDGKISGSVWNNFIDTTNCGGNKIKNYISVENAMKSITTYVVRQSAQYKDKSADDLANEWLNDETISDTAVQKVDKSDSDLPEIDGGVLEEVVCTGVKPRVKNMTILDCKTEIIRPQFMASEIKPSRITSPVVSSAGQSKTIVQDKGGSGECDAGSGVVETKPQDEQNTTVSGKRLKAKKAARQKSEEVSSTETIITNDNGTKVDYNSETGEYTISIASDNTNLEVESLTQEQVQKFINTELGSVAKITELPAGRYTVENSNFTFTKQYKGNNGNYCVYNRAHRKLSFAVNYAEAAAKRDLIYLNKQKETYNALKCKDSTNLTDDDKKFIQQYESTAAFFMAWTNYNPNSEYYMNRDE